MKCDKCKESLGDCNCPDIDEKLAKLRNNPNFIYKMCLTCEKHYERCECDVPNWGTSHDDVSLEEAMSTPTLGDVLNSAVNRRSNRMKLAGSKAESDDVERRMMEAGCTEEDISNAPPEIQEAVRKLEEAGVGVKVFKGDERELDKILGPSDDNELRVEANDFDKMHYDAFNKSGGKLN